MNHGTAIMDLQTTSYLSDQDILMLSNVKLLMKHGDCFVCSMLSENDGSHCRGQWQQSSKHTVSAIQKLINAICELFNQLTKCFVVGEKNYLLLLDVTIFQHLIVLLFPFILFLFLFF